MNFHLNNSLRKQFLTLNHQPMAISESNYLNKLDAAQNGTGQEELAQS